MISFKDYCKRVDESSIISEDNPYMWKIEGGKGKGKEFAHKSTTVDDHLSAMNYHSAEYQKAMKEKRDSDARHHGMKYHKHKDQIERMGSAGSYLKDSVELDESASRFIQKVNQAANAAASGKHKNAQMHLDNARSFMLGVKSTDMEKIKDAHETYKNLRKKYSGSGGNFTPSHNQVGNAKVSESEELDESTFVSGSPATYGSSGVKFDVKKNKEKSVGEHANGQPKEHHDVYHEGKHIGHVSSYSGYKDKKPAGSRIVTSRKDVRLWQATIHGGEHNRHGSVFNTTPAGSQYYQGGFASKKDALQHLADAHNSNKNR